MTIAIVGAGIAGLTAALAFARTGRRVVVHERSEELRSVGAGIQVPPNAWRILRLLGLERELNAVASAPRSIELRDGLTNAPLTSVVLGPTFERRHDAPYLVVHRGDLQAVLLAAVRSTPSIDLRLGSEIADPFVLDAEIVVGADGVHSTMRDHVRGSHDGATDGGFVAWRTLLPREAVPSLDNARTGVWLGPSAHVVHYPVRSGQTVNVVVIGPSQEASPSDILRSWHDTPRAVVDTGEDWGRWPIVAVSPAPSWRRDRLVLIGDAAHAMWPYAAQGGAMAVEDAWTLAAAIAGTDSLDAWERERRRRVTRVAATAARNRTIYHAGGAVRLARNVMMRSLPTGLLAAPMDAIYRWVPPEIRSRP